MGFFSKTCAKTNLPICAPEVNRSLSEIVVLYPDGRKVEGTYDGYGRVNGEQLLEDCSSKEWDDLKFVVASKYDGERYEDLGESRNELGQGYFLSREFLALGISRGGFKSYAEYKKFFNKYC